MDKEPDQFLNNVKREYEQSKQKRLMNGCQKQWLGFMFLPKVSVFTYENDFGDYEGIDEREAVSEIRDAKLPQQKHAVGCKGAKEKS